jgi:hypothetical protein
MAIVQISRIQIRRGKKNTNTGLPQLASGEFAWAIDTQELYIGNGAVGEGAPYVGNTKILTEHDNILEILATYQYKYDSDIGQSLLDGTVSRSAQNRLDDGAVNARSFGIKNLNELDVGEDQDQAAKLQLALNELAGNDTVTLEFDPGEFILSEPITLPSNVSISGTGKDLTVFKFTETGTAFTSEEDSVRIRLKNFTFKLEQTNSTFLYLDDSTDCLFENLKIEFDNGTAISTPLLTDNLIGIKINGDGFISNNYFKEIEFRRLTYGIYADSNASFNFIEKSLFEYLYQGINLGATSSGGANYNSVKDCIFDKITRQALYVDKGIGNKSIGNTYKDVGATLSGTSTAYSAIKFVNDGNFSQGDFFERQIYLEANNTLFNNNPYVQEVDGVVSRTNATPKKITLTSTPTTTLAFKLPLGNATGFKVDYVFNSTTYGQVRKGTIHLAVDKNNNRVQLVDEYEYIGPTGGDDAILFTATFQTNGGVKVIRVNYTNSNVSDTNTFTYSYSVIS